MGLVNMIMALQTGDTQQSTYHIHVAARSTTNAVINHGPLAGLLPQLNEFQQWVLVGILLLIISLLGLLISLWWRSYRQTKEQV